MKKLQDCVVYQIYPRSFADSNGDGIGDIPGIIEKLPYLSMLGVDMLWISPFYPSPQNDNGYDVSNYCAIDPVFGTMYDFDQLVTESNKYDIGIMIDLVLNHTSTEHEWFQRALSGEEYYRDFYYFKPAKADGSPPTNWQSKFGGNAWEKTPGKSDEYYLHLFDKTQADLNWQNPNVRIAIYKIIQFWMKKGVQGIRFDVINLISKPAVFEDDFIGDGRRFYTDGPRIHEFLREMNEQTFGEKCILTVGEMSSTSPENCVLYSNLDGRELSMVFHFQHLKVDYPNGEKWIFGKVDFTALRDLFHEWQTTLERGNAWDALFWNNHDQPRSLSRFGWDDPKNHEKCALLLAASIHFMRGTPYIYMGEEIGMINPDFQSIESYRDVETLNYYRVLLESGLTEDQTMKIIRARSRDNARIPMQWDKTENAGFTVGHPWLSTADSKEWINVKHATSDPKGVFAGYQKLIRLRKEYKVIQDGNYQPILLNQSNLLAYQRENNAEILVCMNNYADVKIVVSLDELKIIDHREVAVLFSNINRTAINLQHTVELEAYESLILYQNKN